MDQDLHQLVEEASFVAGRPVELQQTKDKKWIVLYMCFGQKPPPKGDTEREALTLFIDYLRASRPIDPGTDSDFEELQKTIDSEGASHGTSRD